MNTVSRYIQCCLYNRTFRCQHHDFFIHIPESRTDTPWVTYSKTFTATSQPTYHITSIPLRTGCLQYVSQINTVFNSMCNIHTLQTFSLTLIVKTLHFTVQAMSHLFQHDICIGIFTRMLSEGSNVSEYFIHICQIEVSAQSKILGTPVIATQKRMYIRNTTLSCCRIT